MPATTPQIGKHFEFETSPKVTPTQTGLPDRAISRSKHLRMCYQTNVKT